MKTKTIFLAAVSAIVVAGGGAGVALAQSDDYGYYGRYDDQAEETRRLNLLQLQYPGAGMAAVPMPGRELSDVDDDGRAGPGDDDGGMGGPTYSGPPSPDDMGADDDAPDAGGVGPEDDSGDADAAPPAKGAYIPGEVDEDDDR